MCLMIVKPGGKTISHKNLENGFDNNPHGAGFAVTNGKQMEVLKGFFKFSEFMEAYKENVDKSDLALIHFRMATHGSQSKENCHPFEVTDGIVMGHNGIITIDTEGDESDTRSFIRQVVKPDLEKNRNLLSENSWRDSVGALIPGNKLAFITSSKKSHIVNENLGSWDDGAWYSNTGYMHRSYCYSGFDSDFGHGNRHVSSRNPRIKFEEFDTEYMQCEECGSEFKGRLTIDEWFRVTCGQCLEWQEFEESQDVKQTKPEWPSDSVWPVD